MTQCNIYDIELGQYFFFEPFSKNEAWKWLETKTNHKAVSISIRNLARIWIWHKSKVERFISFLKRQKLIETKVVSRTLTIYPAKVIFKNETIARHNRDNDIACSNIPESKDAQAYCELPPHAIETIARQNRDNCIIPDDGFFKKEKDQKKENFEVILLKEKDTPYGSIQKEKQTRNSNPKVSVQQVLPQHVNEFASSLNLTTKQVEWELGKFKDYWLATAKSPPKDGIAAFRNWLRKSIEFESERGKYGRPNQTRTAKTSFEQFLAAGDRAIAEYERCRLGLHTNALFTSDPGGNEGVKDIFPVN